MQQTAGSLNIKTLLFTKENQISQGKDLSAFLYIGRWKSLGSLKSFLWCVSQLSGAQILYFHILSSSGLTKGSDCSLMAALLLLSRQAVFRTLCNPMNCSTPIFPVLHCLPEFAQTHVHRVSDAIQASRPLSLPSPPPSMAARWQVFFTLSPLRLTGSHWRAAIPDDCDIFVSRYGRKSSTSQSRRARSKTGAPRKEKERWIMN